MKKSFVAFALCLPLVAFAVDHTRSEEPVDTVQSVIQQQISAFQHDDAKTAYSFASPSVQDKFGNEATFFDMVKRSYGPVYRPGNFAFGRNKITKESVIQEVLISGSDGKDWTAIYQLVKQPDGTYKINGVMIVKSAPGPAI
ncbi:DUF4864 domain-containing protein [Sinorhizobium sp. BG8]|uniref:DUF4864 domain-containing protein n=1 Tax=Sinorhizobium sp. BG8 TaxID=2613773 RepID=UPI00193D73F4|nr:DUF4864 domain-containing protein [Sinorhizobium sp. BG8]QRM55506.1 DUF4864 domain-containing protein [Sinorhizobium sp. BG8]